MFSLMLLILIPFFLGFLEWQRNEVNRKKVISSLHGKFSTEPISRNLVVEKVEYQSQDSKDLHIIIFPGNPGICTFYDEFCSLLQTKASCKVKVTSLSLANHCFDPPSLPSGLEDQISSFERFVREKISQERSLSQGKTKFVFIGHSVGSYLILRVLERLNEQEKPFVSHSFLMFPTFMNMRITKNGKNLFWVMKPIIRNVAAFLVSCLVLIPTFLKRQIIRLVIGGNAPECIVGTSLMLLNYRMARNILFLADQELKEIKNPPLDILNAWSDRLTVYYSAKDAWIRESDMEGLRDIGKLTVIKDHMNLPHDFVTGNVEGMVNLLNEKLIPRWLNQKT